MSICDKCVKRDVCINVIQGLIENDNECSHLVERPRGEWIDEGIMADGHPHHAFRCSECESHIVRIPEETPNFCEYCGSKNGGDT